MGSENDLMKVNFKVHYRKLGEENETCIYQKPSLFILLQLSHHFLNFANVDIHETQRCQVLMIYLC